MADGVDVPSSRGVQASQCVAYECTTDESVDVLELTADAGFGSVEAVHCAE